VRRVTVLRSVARGIQLQNGSDGNRLEFDTSSNNARSGFGLLSSDGNLIAHAIASGNPFSGLQGFTAGGNRVVGGTFNDNGAGVGLADGSDGNLVAGNVTTGNTEVGIAADSSNDNEVTGNRVSHNVFGMRVSGDRNRIVDNLVTDAVECEGDGCTVGIAAEGGTGDLIADNRVIGTQVERAGGLPAIGTVIRGNLVRDVRADGIGIQTSTDENSGFGTVKGTVVVANVVVGSGHDGINVARADNTVARNVALRNGALGIEAVAGVIDGGGNIAHLNGDPRQCLPIACH
jgi:parallel beta-helix repeat protein